MVCSLTNDNTTDSFFDMNFGQPDVDTIYEKEVITLITIMKNQPDYYRAICR